MISLWIYIVTVTASLRPRNSTSNDNAKCTKGPCGPGNDHCQIPAGRKPPLFTFHLNDGDGGCGINDPNGPFYDPVHRMYHLFYQDHLCLDNSGVGRGPSWGHLVSRDFVHWARLPVALWNDKWYDRVAVFTGSVTIVDGKPIIIYPGKMQNGYTYALAVPADPSDPLLHKWKKKGPILNGTGDDPTTAWQTVHGEWRISGYGRGSDAPIYGSMDFASWYPIGEKDREQSGLQNGDCPDLFPLPPLAPGSDTGDALPTHVHKWGWWVPGPPAGVVRTDSYKVGNWTDGAPGPNGTIGGFTPTPGVSHDTIPVDVGAIHAAKTFWDPVKRRRVLWAWSGDHLTVPRSVTYHSKLQQLLFTPVTEVQALRGAKIDSLGVTELPANGDGVVMRAGPTSDVIVTFDIPTGDARLLLDLAPEVSLYVNYTRGARAVKVGMQGYRGANNPLNQTLRLLTTDKQIDVRVLLDLDSSSESVIAEAFWMGGRVSMTGSPRIGRVRATSLNLTMRCEGHIAVRIASAVAWNMTSIWTSTGDVLSTRARYAHPPPPLN